MNQTEFLKIFQERYSGQPNFLQTVEEISGDIVPYLNRVGADGKQYRRLERIFEPERIISFKVIWEDDDGVLQHNRGYRVQHSSARGPYKGGLRFDASVNTDILKFLALEQTFKNALTGLPLGSGKGGSDFNPKGKSDREIKRFCQSFITELYRFIGPETDVPAGDIGVGGREIGYMFGQYKRITGKHEGVLTGKHIDTGGSLGRTEATGYGLVYLSEMVYKYNKKDMKGATAVVSGSGNVATHAAEKLIELGSTVLTLSDRSGYVYKAAGLSGSDVDAVKQAKSEGLALAGIAENINAEYKEGKVWEVAANLYFPCATQNEIDEVDAKTIIDNGGQLVAEGANMPSTNSAIELFKQQGVVFIPAKAANAGGVAVSGLEMGQNAGHIQWTTDEVDKELQEIMANIFNTLKRYGGNDDGSMDYVRGANIGAYIRVDEAMKSLGW